MDAAEATDAAGATDALEVMDAAGVTDPAEAKDADGVTDPVYESLVLAIPRLADCAMVKL